MNQSVTVGDYMSAPVHTIGSDRPLEEAHQIMRKFQIRHLPVLSGGSLVGLLSIRDLYWLETLRDVEPETVLVEEAMTPSPYGIAPETPLLEVAREMAARKYGAAIVMSKGTTVGVFTTTDALRALGDALDPTLKVSAKASKGAGRAKSGARAS
jgi:acetoin utilization protein AcuB